MKKMKQARMALMQPHFFQNVAATFDAIQYALSSAENPLKNLAALFKYIADTIGELEKILKNAGEKIVAGLEIILNRLCIITYIL